MNLLWKIIIISKFRRYEKLQKLVYVRPNLSKN